MSAEEIEGILRRMLSGDVDLVEGCRILVRHQGELEQVAPDEYAVIAGVDSETDHFPAGQQRPAWSKEALQLQDRERERYLETARPALLAACHDMLAKLPH